MAGGRLDCDDPFLAVKLVAMRRLLLPNAPLDRKNPDCWALAYVNVAARDRPTGYWLYILDTVPGHSLQPHLHTAHTTWPAAADGVVHSVAHRLSRHRQPLGGAH